MYLARRVQADRRYHHANPSLFFSSLEGGITKIVHQSWKTHDLLPNHAVWRESWKENHPDWVHRLWTDKENHDLISVSFPWLLEAYVRLPHDICRADLSRYAYMYVYGGVYVDLDFESIRPLDGLLHNVSIALGYDLREGNVHYLFGNAFMASAPGHPFWIHVLTGFLKVFSTVDTEVSPWAAVDLTGPGAIYRAWEQFKDVSHLPIFGAPADTIYPLHQGSGPDPCFFQGPDFDAGACKASHAHAYAVTYWTGSWYRT